MGSEDVNPSLGHRMPGSLASDLILDLLRQA